MIARVLIASGVATACASGTKPSPLAPHVRSAIEAVQQSPATAGAQVYEGQVFALDGRPAPLFRYARRVPPFETINGRPRTLDARVAYRFVAADFR
jgi:hypothetical protein